MLGPLLAEVHTTAMLLPFHKLCHLQQVACHRYSLSEKPLIQCHIQHTVQATDHK